MEKMNDDNKFFTFICRIKENNDIKWIIMSLK